MKIFTLVLLCLMLYIPSHAEDLDTVWTLKKSGIDYVKFSPDGSKIYGSHNNSITEIESSTGKILRSFDPVSFDLRPEFMEITKDGKYVLTADINYKIFAWDTENGKSMGELDYLKVIYSRHNFTIHPSEHKIYFGCIDTIVLYDIDSNKVVFHKILPNATIVNMKASKDNKYLAISSEYFNASHVKYQKSIIILETKNFSVVKTIIDNVQDLFSFDFSADSKYITYVYSEDRRQFCGVYNIETSENKLFANNRLLVTPRASNLIGLNNLILVSGYDCADNFFTSVFDYNSKSILYTVKYGGDLDNFDINNKNEIIISSYGQSRCLALMNSRWFTTSVPSDPRIKMNGNMKIKYVNKVLSLDNTDSELIQLISIFNINGKLVKTYDAGYSGATVDLPFVAPAGVYLVRILTDQSDYNFKFVRE